MKRFVKILLVILMVTLPLQSTFAWSSKGHWTIGYIADMNLSPQARKMCDKYLGGSLADNASWMDKVRLTKEYHHTARWHSVGVKEGKFVPSNLTGSKARYDTPMQDDDYGVAQVIKLRKQLRNYRKLSDSTVVDGLKCLIHMVGDLHCPGHTFFADQSQQYHLKVAGKKIHFHTFVDRAYLRYNDGVTAEQFYAKYCNLSKSEIKTLCKRSVEDWIWDNENDFRECYKLLPPMGEYDNLSDSERRCLKEIMDRLHRDAGYRLAHIINRIFK